MAEFVPIRQTTLCDIRSETELDADLSALATMIIQGWPDSKTNVPCLVTWAFRDVLEELETLSSVLA